MVSDKSFGIIDILIILFTFGSVVLDSGDNLLKLIKVLFVIPCFVYVVKTLNFILIHMLSGCYLLLYLPDYPFLGNFPC